MSGFYGKITNFDKSAFKFDKIYPNRAAMENQILIENGDIELDPESNVSKEDGVFIGRYVLIDYSGILTGSAEDKTEENKQIDINEGLIEGNGSRTWNSTVWQKTYIRNDNNKLKKAYKFIADLSTAKPQISVRPAPPGTEMMLTPETSEDIYDFQVPEEWNINLGDVDFNKAGFDMSHRTYSDPETNVIELTSINDGTRYTYYDNNGQEKINEATENTKKLDISLPGIGNAICKVWDILYGTNRNTDVSWDSTNGHRFLKAENLLDGDNLNTVSAVINSIHDLMGMIVEVKENTNDVSNWDAGKIYRVKEDGEDNYKYYIRYNIYSNGQLIAKQTLNNGLGIIKYNGKTIESWNNYIDGMALNPVPGNNIFLPYKYYKDSECKEPILTLEEYNNTSKIYEPQSVTATPIELMGFGEDLNTIHGWLIRLNHILMNGNSDTLDISTVEGCINKLTVLIKGYESRQTFRGDDWISAEPVADTEVLPGEQTNVWQVTHQMKNWPSSVQNPPDTINITPKIDNGGNLSVPMLVLDKAGHIDLTNWNFKSLNDVVTYDNSTVINRISIYNNNLNPDTGNNIGWEELIPNHGHDLYIENHDNFIKLSVEKDDHEEDYFSINHNKYFSENQHIETNLDNTTGYYINDLFHNTIKSNYVPDLEFDTGGHLVSDLGSEKNNLCSINFLNTDGENQKLALTNIRRDIIELYPDLSDTNNIDFYLPEQRYASFVAYNPMDRHHIDIRSEKIENLSLPKNLLSDSAEADETIKLGDALSELKTKSGQTYGFYIASNLLNYYTQGKQEQGPYNTWHSWRQIDGEYKHAWATESGEVSQYLAFDRAHAIGYGDLGPDVFYYNDESKNIFLYDSTRPTGNTVNNTITINKTGFYKIWGQAVILYTIPIANNVIMSNLKLQRISLILQHGEPYIVNPDSTNPSISYNWYELFRTREAADLTNFPMPKTCLSESHPTNPYGISRNSEAPTFQINPSPVLLQAGEKIRLKITCLFDNPGQTQTDPSMGWMRWAVGSIANTKSYLQMEYLGDAGKFNTIGTESASAEDYNPGLLNGDDVDVILSDE